MPRNGLCHQQWEDGISMSAHISPATRARCLGAFLLTLALLLAVTACTTLKTAAVGSTQSPTHLTITRRAQIGYLPYSAFGDLFSLDAECLPGEQVVGGGYSSTNVISPILYNILESHVDASHQGWQVGARFDIEAANFADPLKKNPPSLIAYAYCLMSPLGPRATPGPPAISYLQSAPTTTDRFTNNPFSAQTASCPSGSALTAGGFAIINLSPGPYGDSRPNDVWVSASQPSAAHGWQFSGVVGRDSNGLHQLTAYAVCVAGLTATLASQAGVNVEAKDLTSGDLFQCTNPLPTDSCQYDHVILKQSPPCPADSAITGGAFELDRNPLYVAQLYGPVILVNAPGSFGDPAAGTWSLTAQVRLRDPETASEAAALGSLATGFFQAICLTTR
jgi:hypothetical protein